MKKAVLLFSFFILLSVGLFVSNQIFSTNSKSAAFNASNEKTLVAENVSDEKILVVEKFWNQASNSSSVDDFIVNVPEEFYDETPRSSSKENKNNSESVNIDTKKESGFTRDLMTTAKNIGNERRVLKKTRIFRQWKNEAIVEAEYEKDNQSDILEKTYFFLYLTDGKWKIFLSTKLPDLLNKEFAKDESNL